MTLISGRFVLRFCGMVALAACGSDESGPPPGEELTMAPVVGSGTVFALGSEIQLELRDNEGNPVAGANWSSSNPAVLAVTPTGYATAGVEGNATVEAEANGQTVSQSFVVSATAQPIVSVRWVPVIDCFGSPPGCASLTGYTGSSFTQLAGSVQINGTTLQQGDELLVTESASAPCSLPVASCVNLTELVPSAPTLGRPN